MLEKYLRINSSNEEFNIENNIGFNSQSKIQQKTLFNKFSLVDNEHNYNLSKESNFQNYVNFNFNNNNTIKDVSSGYYYEEFESANLQEK